MGEDRRRRRDAGGTGAAKTYLTGAYPLRFDGNGPIARILVGMQMDGLPIDYIETRNDMIDAVTLEDVNRVAARIYRPEDLHFVVVGQPDGVGATNRHRLSNRIEAMLRIVAWPSRTQDHGVIRRLDEAAINRIAAGEVVERPASAVKELVENALDAGAGRIEVDIADGGKTLIRVTDDGCGIPADDLPLALARHATSKIDGTDLLDIRSFGFRGEALASLGAVARLTLTSRAGGGDAGGSTWTAGAKAPPVPPRAARGTVVELRDLFYATPARLKFLRTDRAEAQAIADVVRRLAIAEPGVASP